MKRNLDIFKEGDTISVYMIVKEGDNERIQVYSGIVISHRGRGINQTFTFRKISYGERVERIYSI
jgi:large subunit ribosomal protein L19